MKPSQSNSRPVPTTVEVAQIALHRSVPGYTWRVVSDCGVVKIYSSRDGCLMAFAPTEARRFASMLADALEEAADCTEVRSYGHVVSRVEEE